MAPVAPPCASACAAQIIPTKLIQNNFPNSNLPNDLDIHSSLMSVLMFEGHEGGRSELERTSGAAAVAGPEPTLAASVGEPNPRSRVYCRDEKHGAPRKNLAWNHSKMSDRLLEINRAWQ